MPRRLDTGLNLKQNAKSQTRISIIPMQEVQNKSGRLHSPHNKIVKPLNLNPKSQSGLRSMLNENTVVGGEPYQTISSHRF